MSASAHEVRGATAGRNGTLHECGVINTSVNVLCTNDLYRGDRILGTYLLVFGSGLFFTFRRLDDGELISHVSRASSISEWAGLESPQRIATKRHYSYCTA